jgi:hypothetical protein
MVPVLYTTYGLAMGHHPEVLAESGGLRPAACERTLVPGGLARRWLVAAMDRVRLRSRVIDTASAGREGMTAPLVPSNQRHP